MSLLNQAAPVPNMNEQMKMCPVITGSGQGITDFRTRCAVNADIQNQLQQNNMVLSSHESRMYLQRNAEKEIQRQRNAIYERLTPCSQCKLPSDEPETVVPERYATVCNEVSCYSKEVNKDGVGNGRSF
jgi:hypothetical protein